jgi:hypothetical protein
MTNTTKPINTPQQVLFASLIGTTIEFFDFYIYATAAVLVFPRLFFPASDPASATLASLATFAIAFLARPLGSALFGHFGDRIGRKATLVAALLTMGASTVLIGVLPTYHTIGIAAPLLLALCRFGQGLGLGGEWGGAVLLAVENAPPGKRAWYGMFPQLGAPLGFFFSGSTFLLLSRLLTDDQFFQFGWRIPFLASAALVIVGLYVRLTITETDLEKARLGTGTPSRARAVGRALHRQLETLLVHQHLREAIPKDRVRKPAGVAEVAPGDRNHRIRARSIAPAAEHRGDHLAFVAEQRLGDRPAVVDLGDHVLLGDPDVFEKRLAEGRSAADQADRPDRHSRRVQVEQDEGDPLLFLGGRIGADQEEHPVRLVAVAGPGLLAVDQEVIAVVGRGALQ